jgi:cyclic pyranopterin phosphate synthase
MSKHHCRTCNRLRLSSDGKVRPCLLRSQELDLKGPLRQGVSDDFLNYLFQEAIQLKNWKTGHSLPNHGLILRDLPMVSIGG